MKYINIIFEEKMLRCRNGGWKKTPLKIVGIDMECDDFVVMNDLSNTDSFYPMSVELYSAWKMPVGLMLRKLIKMNCNEYESMGWDRYITPDYLLWDSAIEYLLRMLEEDE